MIKNGDLPASPTHWLNQDREGDYKLESVGGLTKRETMAMAAMQGMLANPDIDHYFSDLAEHCVKHADALLKALEGQQLSTQDSELLESSTGCSMAGLDKLTSKGDS